VELKAALALADIVLGDRSKIRIAAATGELGYHAYGGMHSIPQLENAMLTILDAENGIPANGRAYWNMQLKENKTAAVSQLKITSAKEEFLLFDRLERQLLLSAPPTVRRQ
jgi:hypothetical protein